VFALLLTFAEESVMSALPLPALFGTVGALLIIAIYFVWGRRLGKT
jgi:hypothetical protein